MRRAIIRYALGLLLCLAAARGEAAKFYLEAEVVSMNLTTCQKVGGGGFIRFMAGETQQSSFFFCAEYVLETDRVTYRIHARDHSALLPVGEPVQFRFAKNRVLVRVEDSEEESEFDVVSMELRSSARQTRR